MAESLGEATLDLTTDATDLDRGIDQAEKKAVGLDKTFQRVGKNLSSFGDKMSTRVTLPLVAAGAAAFKLAADAEEAGNKFDVVMGGSADRVRERLEALTDFVPLTIGEFEGLAAGVQDLLVPMGLARDAGAEMSATFVEIAGDVAAFNDVSPAQVLDDIRSGLVGSSEPLFKYGVDTRVAALEAVALKNGLIEQGEALDDTARAQAVLLQIQAQTTDATGTAAREAESAAAQTRLLARDIRQLGEEIGAVLLPIITPMVQGLRDMVNWFRELNPTTQEWVVKIGLAVAAIGPLLSITGRLLTVGGKIAGMLTARTAATVANTAATTANTAANTANATSLAGGKGMVSALGKATAALGAFWVGWEAGSFLNDQLEEQGWTLANLLDSVGFYGESIQEITADVNEAAKATGEYRTAAQIQADVAAKQAEANTAVAAAIVQVDTATTDAVDPAVRYAEAMASLGIATEKDIATELENLALAVAGGELPAATMIPLLEEFKTKWIELGRLSPEQVARIDAMTEAVKRQDAAIDGIVGEMPKATDAMNIFKGAAGALPGVVVPSSESVEQALTNMAAAGETNAFALAEMIAKSEDLTFEQGLALTAYRDNTDQMQQMAEKLRGEWGPAIQASTEKQLGLNQEVEKGTTSMAGFLGGILEGIPILGEFGKAFDFVGELIGKGVGKINEFVQKGTGFLQEKLGGLFAEGSKLGSFLSDGLGKAVGFAIPFIGPLIAPFVGKLAGLVGKGIKKIGGFFKGLFGGVSGAEKEGRAAAGAFRDATIAAMKDTKTLEVINQQWSDAANRQNATFLAKIQQDLIAMGHSAEQAGAMARSFGTQLWEAEKQGGAAVQSVIDQIAEASKTSVKATEEVAAASTEALEQTAAAGTSAVAQVAAESAAAVVETATTASTAVEIVATETSNTVEKKVAETAATVSTGFKDMEGTASSTLERIERRFADADLTLGIDFDLEDFPGGKGGDGGKERIPAFARGGVVSGPKGQAQLAVVHGGERISPPGEGGGGTIVVPVNLDGREVTKVVVRLTPEITRKLGLA
ncbi:MAG: hypothetical protein GY898_23005 [Proteobacteria bacterium]|nr:hypothetical protein [Pseudomonadota bacterium]